MSKLGFIGTGNMGTAIAVACARTTDGADIYLANRTLAKAEKLAKELNANVSDNLSIAQNCDYIFLGVKPQMMKGVLNQINPVLKNRKNDFVLVSMAAGFLIDDYKKMTDESYRVVRIMPNTPAMINEGLILFSPDTITEEDRLNELKDLLKGAGLVEECDEHLMSPAGTVAGCGPAFAAMFIESLADGGVACGLPRAKALTYAAQMLKGSAELYLQTKKPTSQLKDEVCSPGGSTIQGVRTLEEHGFRAGVIDAVINANEAGKNLGK